MKKGKGLTVEDVPKLWTYTLIYIISYVIIRLGIVFITEEEIMFENILINIGCTVICSLILNVFIYYKYLKRIPQETKKSIDDLLNARLGYETSNHNAIMQAPIGVPTYLELSNEKIEIDNPTFLDYLNRENQELKEETKLLLSENKRLRRELSELKEK